MQSAEDFMGMFEGVMRRSYGEKRSSTLRQETAVKMIKDNCSDALEWWFSKNENTGPYDGAGEGLFRGVSNTGYFVVTDPLSGEPRKSSNIRNYVNMMMANFPEWSSLPSRERSVICTNARSYATGYGKLHVVFPFNGSHIGVSSQFDIFHTKMMESWDYSRLNSSLEVVLNLADKLKVEYAAELQANRKLSQCASEADLSWEGLLKALDELDYIIRLYPDRMAQEFTNTPVSKYISNLDSYRNLIGYFQQEFDFEGSGIEHFRTDEIDRIPEREAGNEIWVEGKCVLVAPNFFRSFDEMKEVLS